jgi:hypothetical protein
MCQCEYHTTTLSDRFHEYKLANPYILPDCLRRQFELGLATGEEQATRLAHDWVMIALTRAIDTLVIGLHECGEQLLAGATVDSGGAQGLR